MSFLSLLVNFLNNQRKSKYIFDLKKNGMRKKEVEVPGNFPNISDILFKYSVYEDMKLFPVSTAFNTKESSPH